MQFLTNDIKVRKNAIQKYRENCIAHAVTYSVILLTLIKKSLNKLLGLGNFNTRVDGPVRANYKNTLLQTGVRHTFYCFMYGLRVHVYTRTKRKALCEF